MTAPPYEWATTTVGPFWASINRLVVSTSAAYEVSGFSTALTSYPFACRMRMTASQPEAFAKAPCTSTIAGFAAGLESSFAGAVLRTAASASLHPNTAASNKRKHDRDRDIETSLKNEASRNWLARSTVRSLAPRGRLADEQSCGCPFEVVHRYAAHS